MFEENAEYRGPSTLQKSQISESTYSIDEHSEH